MIRSIALASAIALAGFGAARAESAPQIVGGGEDIALVYAAPSRNVAGGGAVRLSGGAADRSFAFDALQAMPGRDAAIIGGGQDRQIVVSAAARPAILARAR